MARHSFDSRPHSALLDASLENLQLQGDLQNIPHNSDGANDDGVINEFRPNLTENIDSHKAAAESSKAPVRSNPDVRPPSPDTAISTARTESPIPDPNGLGWPGARVRSSESKFSHFIFFFSFVGFQQSPPSSD